MNSTTDQSSHNDDPANDKMPMLRKTATRLIIVLQLYQIKLLDGDNAQLWRTVEAYVAFLATEPGKAIAKDLGVARAGFAKQFGRDICASIDVNGAKIIELLISQVPDYVTGGLNPTCKALLEVAVAEYLLAKAPKKVILNEYIILAETMLGENEVGFVNSILDKIFQ